ncbi:MAG: histidine kinase [Gemmatimonadota bacterium]
MRISRASAYGVFAALFVGAVIYLSWHGHGSVSLWPPPGPTMLRRSAPGLSKELTLLTWWAWLLALLAMPVFWRLSRPPSSRTLSILLGAFVLVGALVSLVTSDLATARWLGAVQLPWAVTLDPRRIALEAVPFIVVALVVHLLRARDAENALRAQAAESRLQALTAQLQPHFLFNTLQAISTALNRDPMVADRMVAGLAALLRSALDGSKSPVVGLDRELELLAAYVGIMRERFGDRVSVSVDVDPSLVTATVPVLVLQPLVENAFRHAVEAREGAASISVKGRRNGAHLVLTVSDDGPGAASGDSARGTGLANTSERLAALYRGNAALEVSSPIGGGMTVELRIPLGQARA